ncbi:hydrogen peroxide-inducible genes activator [Parvularcula sp. IMCC14364]|uniref:hydrogen peroxide-inducible genes activator n=1 Tax=Parvularcula sp. IMCC14364 TaxID=3067902 RepID=UPI002741876C|nr:hydrogen peroxide-inducible genes activator [Parvularcula sp. IMCC14364]
MTPLPTLRQLQFFIALAQQQSFSRAADACLVSQSTLSAAIKELESTLDAQLVDRSSRSFTLTPVGEVLVERARALLAQAEDFARVARKSEPLSGVVNLGIIPTIAPYVLPKAMPQFRRKYPDLSLYLREALSATLIDYVRSGQIDIALIAFPYNTEGLESLVFAEDSFLFACSAEHRLASRAEVSIDELNARELLLLEDGHCLRDHALSACQLQEKELANTFGGTSIFTLAQMVRSGIGATLLPEMAVRQGLAKSSSLITIPFREGKGETVPGRQIGFVWRKGSGRRQDVEAMEDIFTKVLSA